MNTEKPAVGSDIPYFMNSVRGGDSFVDAASRTLLPRLRELKSPQDLRGDEAIVELLELMFPAEGTSVGSEWTHSQLTVLVDTLPPVVDELEKLEYINFAAIGGRIRDFVARAQNAMDALALAAQREQVAQGLGGKQG